MRKLRTDQLQPGMVVAKDIMDITGKLLVAKGVTLSEKLIPRLSQREVDFVWVESDEEEISLSPKEIERIKEEIRENLEKRFHLVAQDPIMRGLKERMFDYLVERRTE